MLVNFLHYIRNSLKTILTPKKLMISRYEAFIKEDWKYIAQTSINQTEEDLQKSPSMHWLKLDVINDYKNIVEFKAYYKLGETIELLHEKSTFVLVNDEWKYKDGELFNTKIARNEECPCGSGRKFKKCCY